MKILIENPNICSTRKKCFFGRIWNSDSESYTKNRKFIFDPNFCGKYFKNSRPRTPYLRWSEETREANSSIMVKSTGVRLASVASGLENQPITTPMPRNTPRPSRINGHFFLGGESLTSTIPNEVTLLQLRVAQFRIPKKCAKIHGLTSKQNINTKDFYIPKIQNNHQYLHKKTIQNPYHPVFGSR